MTYERPMAEVVRFEQGTAFMTGSVNFSNASEALAASCGGYNGAPTNNFACSDFGGYNAGNPPHQKSEVTLANGVYVFDFVGNHWKCSVVN